MQDIYVVYWSGTGNTEAMAKAVGEGVSEAGANAKVVEVSTIKAEDLKDMESYALGCPAMGAEVLEEGDMEPFVTDLEAYAAGKTIGLFGSYDWGDGEWMREWTSRMETAGASVVGGAGVIANNEPGDSELEECRALGRALVKK